MTSLTSPQYTPLNETAAQAIASALPTGFDAAMAALLGEACLLTYAQYQEAGAPVDLSSLTLAGGAASYSQIGTSLTSWESIGLGAVQPGSAGFVQLPFGFAFAALDSNSNVLYNVIALRGTQSYQEWVNDAGGVPTSFRLFNSDLGELENGWVHDGFYTVYTRGTPGGDDTVERPAGSLAAQIATLMDAILATAQSAGATVPLYVTGHSLGGALAELCALDIGANYGVGAFSSSSEYWSTLNVYSLAAPMVSAGLTTPVSEVQLSVETFVKNFQGKYGPTNAFRVVHAADLVPILPPALSVGSSGFGVEFAHPTPNVVTFLAQSGSIGGNHACDLYAAFLHDLLAQQSTAGPRQVAVPAIAGDAYAATS